MKPLTYANIGLFNWLSRFIEVHVHEFSFTSMIYLITVGQNEQLYGKDLIVCIKAFLKHWQNSTHLCSSWKQHLSVFHISLDSHKSLKGILELSVVQHSFVPLFAQKWLKASQNSSGVLYLRFIFNFLSFCGKSWLRNSSSSTALEKAPPRPLRVSGVSSPFFHSLGQLPFLIWALFKIWPGLLQLPLETPEAGNLSRPDLLGPLQDDRPVYEYSNDDVE